MTSLRIAVPVAAVALVLGACSKKAPEAPTPVQSAPAAPATRPAAPAPATGNDEDAARRAAEQRLQAALASVVFFDYDTSELREDARQTLTALAGALRDNPGVRLRIEGHADERGSLEYNVALGMRRALSVKEFLADLGLEGTRFEVFSYGEERPLAVGTGESVWSQNRRGEFKRGGGR